MTEPQFEQINLNLDLEERKGFPPYRFVIGGHMLTFTDPTVHDWQVLEHLTTIDALAEHCMSEEDRKTFYKTPMAAFKLPILFDDVQRHFELGEYATKIRR
jgi:hypothetical protein